jgi:uncharacterized protein YdgA (DUF945 family)
LQYIIIANWSTLNKPVLAAFAAICLSGNALAAPPVDFLSDIHTARQAIEHEMARRVDPGKGKPIVLDQPSGQQPTEAETAALQAVFGTVQPLVVKRSGAVGKATHYSATLPAVEYSGGDTRFTWRASSWQYSVTGNTVDTTVRWPYINVLRPEFKLDFLDIRTDGRQTRGAYANQTQLQAGVIIFQETKGNGSAHAEAMQVRQQTTEKNKKLAQHIEFSTRRLRFGNGVVLDDLHLDLHMRDLNANLWQQITDATNTDQADLIRTVMKPLMLQGARLELDDASVRFGGGTVRIRGDLGMPGVKPHDLSTVEGAFDAVEADLHVELPLATLRSFAMVATHHKLDAAGEPVLDPQAQETYSYLLGKIIADGYARLEKDTLIADVEIKRGQITINGRTQPYSLIQLFAMLHKQQNQTPPEEDHTPPAALLWRDLPLDSLLLFGNNGDQLASRELCRRYVLFNDTEAAQRWCGKAGMPASGPSSADEPETAPAMPDNTLHHSVEAGHYGLDRFHFDATRARSMTIKLSNPQVHQQWAPGMTVCISADVPSDRACLAVTKYDGVERMRIASQLYTVDNRKIGSEQVVAQQPPLGEPVKLKVYVDGKQAHFLVAGQELVQDVVFPASVITLMCSTADCDFSFD